MNDLECRLERIDLVLKELYPKTECFLRYNKDYELLFAIILSAQALDSSVNKVTPVLFNKFPSLKDLANAKEEDVIEIIKSVGLSKTKGKNIIKTAKILNEEYYDKLPMDLDALQKLPGVGYKTAGVLLAELNNYPIIPVDTHILRVTNRLLFNGKVCSADKASIILSNDYRFGNCVEFHRRVILFGRNICSARSPKCEFCPLKELCYYKKVD